MGFWTMKQLHGFAITTVTVGTPCAWCKAQRGQAEYDRLAALCINAGRSNPSKSLSAEIVPRFDAAQRNLGT